MSVKKLPLEEFKAIYSKVPRLCVDLVIRNKDEILLTLRDIKPAGRWHLPGGTVLHRESLEDTAKRVAKEELGIDIKIQKLLGAIDFYNDKTGLGHPVSIAFEASPIGNKIKLDSQAKKYKYFKKIPDNSFTEQKEFLEKLLS